MIKVTSLSEAEFRPRKIAIGTFDGVHVGHRAVIAGADTVLLVGPVGAAVFLAHQMAHPDADADPHHDIARILARHMHNVDVVLCEGYAPVHDLLIEVEREGVPPKPASGARVIWVTITDRPVGTNSISFDALADLAARIAERVELQRPGRCEA